MTPLFPLRMLLTGIFSWALLLGGLYGFWELWQRTQATNQVAVNVNQQLDDPLLDQPVDRDDPQIAADQFSVAESRRPLQDWPTWAVIALGVGATGWSFGGARLLGLLRPRREDDPKSLPAAGEVIARPDGSHLHVQIFGNPVGPTLIFTHGWSLDRSGWFYAPHDLASRFRIVLWDLPGLGRSTAADNRDQSLEKMARDLDAVVQHVANGQPVTLVGHSIGGMILQVYSRLYPEHLGTKISALALVNTTFKNPLTTMLLAPVWTALQWPLIVPLHYVMIGLAPLAWVSNWKSYLDGSSLLFSRLTSFTGQQTWGQLDHSSRLSAQAWPAVVARGNLAMFGFDETNTLPKIPIPVLVLAGDHDRVTQRRASEYMAGALSQGTLASYPGGHLQLYEYHPQLTARIASFVDQALDIDNKAIGSVPTAGPISPAPQDRKPQVHKPPLRTY